MIDLNNQILKLNYDDARDEISRLVGLGYTDLILTFPTLENGEYGIEEMVSKFNLFKVSIKGIRLWLGNEVHFHYTLIHRLKQKDILTLNQSEYLLLRLPKKNPLQLKQLIGVLQSYKIILSCIEEINYFSMMDLIELKKMGVLFLVSANHLHKPRARQLLRKGLADFLVTYDNLCDISQNKFVKRLDLDYLKKITHDNLKEIVKFDL